MPLGFQVIFRTPEGRVLTPTVASRRKMARVIQSVGRGRGLIGFGVVDTHGHVGLVAALQQIGAFIHDLRVSLRHQLGLEIEDPKVKPINDAWHAVQLIAYMHRQGDHHGVDRDVFLEATSLPDLSGMRANAPWILDVVEVELPRFEGCTLPTRWGTGALSQPVALDRLADGTAAAFALPDLNGRSSEVVVARRAAVHAAWEHNSHDVAAALCIAERTVRELRTLDSEPARIAAVRRSVSVRTAIAANAIYTPAKPDFPRFVRESAAVYLAG